ncbi:MAG: hypothetical protein AB1801_15765 [Chloroflexota bacterium]
MTTQQTFITIDWQEQGPIQDDMQRLWKKGRKICTPDDYPQQLPCHNPECAGGGFEIGARIAALLASGESTEQNSLICINAIHKDRDKRCLHTIFYSISCVHPFQRSQRRATVADKKSD